MKLVKPKKAVAMKFALGNVVYLKSAWASGGVPGVVVDCHEADGVRPDRYDVLMQSRDGAALNKFEAPEFTLIGEDEAAASLRGNAQ